MGKKKNRKKKGEKITRRKRKDKKTKSRKRKGEKTRTRKKKERKTKSRKKKDAKIKDKKKKLCRYWEKTNDRKGEKAKAKKKRKNNTNKGRHGPAYYFNCVTHIKTFVSRMKKASNLIRQAKRIKAFREVINNKLAKVGNK